MKYTIITPLFISDWQALRKSIFGNAQPIFEEFGNGVSYVVEFKTAQTPVNLSPLIKVEVVQEPVK